MIIVYILKIDNDHIFSAKPFRAKSANSAEFDSAIQL